MKRTLLRPGFPPCGLALLLSVLFASMPAAADTKTSVTTFTYYDATNVSSPGLLNTRTEEPDDPSLCLKTAYAYDYYRNPKTQTQSNCAGAAGLALFRSQVRTALSDGFTDLTIPNSGVAVTVPLGAFPNKISISDGGSDPARILSQNFTYDPRYGTPLSESAPNGATTKWSTDGFGRTVRVTLPDGTSLVSHYCIVDSNLDTRSNSSDCTSLVYETGEKPSAAVLVVHTEPRNTSNVKMGAFERRYFDSAGRVIRVATEAFDGSGQPAAAGKRVVKDTRYNDQGLAVFVSQPYFLASGSSTTAGSSDAGGMRVDYDAFGRPSVVHVADLRGSAAGVAFPVLGTRTAARTSYTYDGLTTTITNDKGKTRTEERNALGQLVRVTDDTGAQASRRYDAFGGLAKTRDALQNQVTLAYDKRGRKVSMTDPDLGVIGYCYDAAGQLRAHQNSKMRGGHTLGDCPSEAGGSTTIAASLSGWTTYAYDFAGRMTQRIEPEYSSTWGYDTCASGKGLLCRAQTSSGADSTYVYDSAGRVTSSKTATGTAGPVWASALEYDTVTGRLSSQTWPTGLKARYAYTDAGYLAQLTLATGVTVDGSAVSRTLWTRDSVDAWGDNEKQTLGNSVTSRATFDASLGRQLSALASSTGGNAMDQGFSWDSLGRMIGRVDSIGDGSRAAVSETFDYDSINRLKSYVVAAPQVPNLSRTVTLQHNAIGSVLYKSDVGNYGYPASGAASLRPHAVTQVNGASFGYDDNGNLTSSSNGRYSALGYTSFDQPLSASGAGSASYSWQYDVGHQRLKEIHTTPQGTRTTWFAHPDNQGGLGFEHVEEPDGTKRSRHYLSAGGQTVMLLSAGALPDLQGADAPTALASMGLVKVEYWHTDALGSVASTTDHTGQVTARYAYDPFGKRRYTSGRYDEFGSLVIDWSDTPAPGTGRGFGSHQQLDDIGIVHMNGRLYDPRIGRFLQADPFVPQPDDLQSFNRYSYCRNNPVNCVDPSGYMDVLNDADLGGFGLQGWAGGFTALSGTYVPPFANFSCGDGACFWRWGWITPERVDLYAVRVESSQRMTTDIAGNYANFSPSVLLPVQWAAAMDAARSTTPVTLGSAGAGATVVAGATVGTVAAKEAAKRKTVGEMMAEAGIPSARSQQQIDEELAEFRKLSPEERAKQTLLNAAPIVAGAAAGSALSKEAAKGVGEAYNVANASKLAEQLTMQSAKSPFTAAGTLTKNALASSQPVRNLGPGQLSNPAIPSGFGKYTTETFQSVGADRKLTHL
jgi:RHS repeat-associated protein